MANRVFPTAYFAPIFQFALMSSEEKYSMEVKESFVKQSYRSRCEIYGANGLLKLIVPLEKWKNHSRTEEIKISYDENWQLLHWRSIESAYRSSPYFEFYEDDIRPILLNNKPTYLIDLNYLIDNKLKQLLNISSTSIKTEKYESFKQDLRKIIHPKSREINEEINYPFYIQVFTEKYGFIKNLSIIDLLFNLGPESNVYLNKIAAEYEQEN